MKTSNLFFLISSFFLISTLQAQDITVSNLEEYNAAISKISEGGTIILKNGEWKDTKLLAYGNGSKENPIIIKAETAGEVILTGDSSLSIYGTYVIVSGLWFKDGKTTEKYVVQFRKNSKEFANHCRLTNSTISYFDVADDTIKNHWVDLWGKNNRVDHNNFTGKTSAGTTLVVWLKGEEHIENNHQIDHNYFGHRPDLGENGGETIRIGTSANSMKSSKTIVESNTFKNCDGEIEIISNKSADNIFRNNLFIESKGTLTLRHGNNALVEGNIFLGNNVSQTGGIRIINEGHIIRNNLLIGLKGNGYRGPIVIMNGVPNSPLNRYNQVKNVNIQNNTIINCGPMAFGAGKNEELSLAPITTIFANNIITNTDDTQILETVDTVDGITFSGNIVDSEAAVNTSYFTKANIDWTLLKSLPIPSNNNDILKSVTKTPKSPAQDIVGATREIYVAGAFNLNNTKIPRALTARTGPGWKPNIIAPVTKAEDLIIEPGLGTLYKAFSKAKDGDIITLKSGIYEFTKSLKIKKNITVIGAEDGSTVFKMQDNIEKAFNYFIRINGGAALTIKNITFDATHSKPIKYAIVSPDKMESTMYALNAEQCTFQHFTTQNGGSIFKAYEGTTASSLSFKNCSFLNSYRGLNLSYDKDNFGKYNALELIIDNCVFKDIEEFAVNYIRNIPDVTIKGGKLLVTNSVFDKVGNKEKGKVLITNGIHKVTIKNSVFINSYKAETPVNLKGTNNIISNCLFDDNGYPKITKGAKEKNVIYKNPKWEDKEQYIPSKKSPLLKENNGNALIGLKRE
ncbi:polysaccharide lyase 6 family protein [Winogradskyella sediminis]|uniref:polysaccharide lyase 6 family protein n=1 Tax=Winogradskyella sediminis TaxID=1382466 RepID=UPI000E224030|nr:polysaccharide lyase 6 family protein [Winogradskyella sediminis]REG89072.1 poly(beta-D-mannuronate) lyase [Winogradskyella sediminis]